MFFILRYLKFLMLVCFAMFCGGSIRTIYGHAAITNVYLVTNFHGTNYDGSTFKGTNFKVLSGDKNNFIDITSLYPHYIPNIDHVKLGNVKNKNLNVDLTAKKAKVVVKSIDTDNHQSLVNDQIITKATVGGKYHLNNLNIKGYSLDNLKQADGIVHDEDQTIVLNYHKIINKQEAINHQQQNSIKKVDSENEKRPNILNQENKLDDYQKKKTNSKNEKNPITVDMENKPSDNFNSENKNNDSHQDNTKNNTEITHSKHDDYSKKIESQPTILHPISHTTPNNSIPRSKINKLDNSYSYHHKNYYVPPISHLTDNNPTEFFLVNNCNVNQLLTYKVIQSIPFQTYHFHNNYYHHLKFKLSHRDQIKFFKHVIF